VTGGEAADPVLGVRHDRSGGPRTHRALELDAFRREGEGQRGPVVRLRQLGAVGGLEGAELRQRLVECDLADGGVDPSVVMPGEQKLSDLDPLHPERPGRAPDRG
jgi:hypothetical protein